jgi:hypothetical protein
VVEVTLELVLFFGHVLVVDGDKTEEGQDRKQGYGVGERSGESVVVEQNAASETNCDIDEK